MSHHLLLPAVAIFLVLLDQPINVVHPDGLSILTQAKAPTHPAHQALA